jgi:hypothetical protein
MATINISEKNVGIKTGAIYDFTMGADPELVVKNGKTVLGEKILTEHDEFGIDGNHYWFEIRPDPSTSPLEVANGIRAIMVRQCLKNPKFFEYDWFAGSFASNPNGEYGLGGHIHFGIKNERISGKIAAHLLSQYVGAVTVLIEDREQGLKRRQFKGGKYGFIDDQREKPYGFEYRCPSSWITDPKVTAAVLCLAKAVMFEALNNDKFRVPSRIKNNHIVNMEVNAIRELWPDIWNEITKMALYPHYKQYLDMLYFMVKKNRVWFPPVSMKEAWGIVDMGTAAKSKLQFPAIWHKFLNKDSGFAAKKF